MKQITRQQILDALDQDRFQLFGQPKWTFGRNTCQTYEVFVDLLISEEEERILPDAFMPVIEADEQLTMRFGSWFLEHAFADCANLMDQLNMALTISINIFGFQANRPEFIDQVQLMMNRFGLTADNIQFELSERQPLNDMGVRNLMRLREELNIRLVLGNFGMGFSTISLLRVIPFDLLELSRDFTSKIVSSERDLTIAVAILQFAQVLDIKVCAKGIETAEQMELLEEAGFTMGQGYLIGRPMPMDELSAFVRKYAD